MSESWLDSKMENCVNNSLLYHNPLYLSAIIIQGVSSFLFFPSILVLLWKHPEVTSSHFNLKILLYLNGFSCFGLAVITVWSAVNFFVGLFTHNNSCAMLMSTGFCSEIRAVYLFDFCLVSASHVGIFIERTWATVFVKSYEKQGKRLGIILTIVAVITSAVAVQKAIQQEDMKELLTTCLTFSASKSIGNQIYIMFWVQLVLDSIVTVSHYMLYKFNKHKQQMSVGPLTEQFQRKENVKTLKQITPLLILSNITIVLYILVISVLRLFKNKLPANWYEVIAALLFMMPHMPLMFCALLFLSIYLQKRQAAENQTNLMANHIPLSDQFNVPIQDWDAAYDARHGVDPTENGNNSRPSIWNCWEVKKEYKKSQAQVAAIT
ncbi:hypothetical protein B9Z55_026238 [Caenorhabditis nigoni]|uniref:G-protein coupled receptors family 1 profile domain-containing protein n=2 Tax=Caenorhabditis nigoni TaxID=1611254 RepID=A0A2G5T2K5_9PELO|nr:hypothetical protein B9Z55_026238 [Caenorhabditis nigoni]